MHCALHSIKKEAASEHDKRLRCHLAQNLIVAEEIYYLGAANDSQRAEH